MRAALAACALIIAAGLGPCAGVALAGSGVTLSSSANSETVTITGKRIREAVDTGPTSYTVRSSAGSPGTKITIRGLSIRGLLQLAGFDPDTVDFISIARPDGALTTLRRADFANPSPFPEGPALVADEPGGTRFLRPVRGPTSTNARESFVSQAPLDVNVGGGALLPVRASASPRRTSTGRSVSFRASVRFPPPGATLTYEWNFGDGTQGFGAQVAHRYTHEGDFHVQVTATGSGGSTAACPDTCGGTASVSVRVGTAPTSPRPDTTQGAGRANTNGAGNGSGNGSGSGTGTGAGGRRSTGAAAGGGTPGRKPRSQPKPAPPAPARDTITGILLADSGSTPTSSLPALRAAGTATPRESDSGSRGGGKLGGSVALTLALVLLGALHERRGGRLRVA